MSGSRDHGTRNQEMSIQAIIFDLGGVLVRTPDFTVRQRLADRLGMSRAALEHLVFESDSGMRAQRGEIDTRQHWKNVLAELNLPIQELPAFQEDFWGGDFLDIDLVNRIRGLRGTYKTALLSNAFSDLRQVLSERWKIDDAFDELIISSEVGLTKPDARIYHLALERLGVTPAQAIFIDDFIHNVDSARAIGMQAIHFQNPRQIWAELENALNTK
jgi:epoxide hydrolase-like predicted phosphatase